MDVQNKRFKRILQRYMEDVEIKDEDMLNLQKHYSEQLLFRV